MAYRFYHDNFEDDNGQVKREGGADETGRCTDADLSELGVLAAAYRHIGNNVKLGPCYHTGRFSDDLSDLTCDDEGVLINFIAKF